MTQYVKYSVPRGTAMTLTENLFENLRLELRRGCLTLAVLAKLHEERYGYTLRKALADDGLAIDESTLYPLLRRLESQGLAGPASGARKKNGTNAFLSDHPRRQPDLHPTALRMARHQRASVTATVDARTGSAQ